MPTAQGVIKWLCHTLSWACPTCWGSEGRGTDVTPIRGCAVLELYRIAG